MRPRARSPVHCLALCAAWLACGQLALTSLALPLGAAEPEGGYRGRRLVDVLRELQQRGLRLVFSSAVVDPDLRVTREPAASEPRAVLDEILSAAGLAAEEGPAGSLVIVPASPGALRGRVVTATVRRPIAGAGLRLRETGAGTTTGADGSFELRAVPPGTYRVLVEAPGFAPATVAGVRIEAHAVNDLTVELRPSLAIVTEVVVTPSQRSVVLEDGGSRHTVAHGEVVLTPAIGGDVSRVVELLPGVATHDNSAAFNVRGGVTRDVSVVLDGLELYDPFHLRSFQSPFSVIDGNVVDRIELSGGGFTADLGDRHGGFVDVSTLVPEEPAQGEVEIGSLNSRASYRAKWSQGAGSLLMAARAWYPEALFHTTELGGGENLNPHFWDVYGKAAVQLSSRHSLSAHGLVVYDRLAFTETGEDVNESVDARTKNGYVWLGALSEWSPRLTSRAVLSGGRIERIRGGVSALGTPLVVEDDREVDFVGVKQDSIWQISQAHGFKAGAEVRWLSAEYRYSSQALDDPASSAPLRLDPDGSSLGAYLAYRARLSPELAAELGARFDRQTHTDDHQLSPRFNAVWRLGEGSELRWALGRFSQSQRIHELQVEDGETGFHHAEVAEQAEVSIQHRFPTGRLLRLDGYVSRLSRLRPRYENLFEPIDLFPETAADRVRIAPEKARLHGVELLVGGDAGGPLVWWVSYALSAADDVIQGSAVPRSWDQTHAVKFLVGYRRDERWSVTLSGSSHTGWPTTEVAGVPTLGPEGLPPIEAVAGERNSDRFPGYLRIDLKARRSFAFRRGRLWLSAEVSNLTDRRNACCVNEFTLSPRPDGTVDVTRDLGYWLGITPSFGMRWEF